MPMMTGRPIAAWATEMAKVELRFQPEWRATPRTSALDRVARAMDFPNSSGPEPALAALAAEGREMYECRLGTKAWSA